MAVFVNKLPATGELSLGVETRLSLWFLLVDALLLEEHVPAPSRKLPY